MYTSRLTMKNHCNIFVLKSNLTKKRQCFDLSENAKFFKRYFKLMFLHIQDKFCFLNLFETPFFWLSKIQMLKLANSALLYFFSKIHIWGNNNAKRKYADSI